MRWVRSHRADPLARPLADRHYNRQSPGHVQFAPSGRCFVLLSDDSRALWITSWPYPEYVKHDWPNAWVCSLFRNEGAGLSSELITMAVAATVHEFGAPPLLGMVTFVNPRMVRHKRDPGRCFRRAGFIDAGHTRGGLLALQLPPHRMPDPEPCLDRQLSIYAA